MKKEVPIDKALNNSGKKRPFRERQILIFDFFFAKKKIKNQNLPLSAPLFSARNCPNC
jgi:hypothetical protein